MVVTNGQGRCLLLGFVEPNATKRHPLGRFEATECSMRQLSLQLRGLGFCGFFLAGCSSDGVSPDVLGTGGVTADNTGGNLGQGASATGGGTSDGG